MARIRAVFYDPEGVRWGVPTWWWRGAPAGYATRRQLRARGLRPGGQPVAAQILWSGVGGVRAAHLYRIDLAKPKRTATPAQLRAVRARAPRSPDMPHVRRCPVLRHSALAR